MHFNRYHKENICLLLNRISKILFFTSTNFMQISESLIYWYNQNKRPLPWRETRDPYKIWLSEVILQQTRVAQGTNYYHRFLVAFPDVQSLAKADEQEVLKLWQGLGYYSRARNMHHAAKELIGNYKGIFPESSAGLKKLKGVGDYTAAAIASICFNESVVVLDGNVARVISRLYAIDTPVDSNIGRNVITDLANSLLDTNHPGTFNQAVMELGALICTPKSPVCNTCPLAFACEALKRNETGRFPVKTPKKVPTVRFMNYLVIGFKQDGKDFILMRKRTGKDIWKNMYDFPCVETEGPFNLDEVMASPVIKNLFILQPFKVNRVSGEYIHQLSHRTILAHFVSITTESIPALASGFVAIEKNALVELPIPRLIDRYLANEIAG
jgi:A/G-specific adenine glycosylase